MRHLIYKSFYNYIIIDNAPDTSIQWIKLKRIALYNFIILAIVDKKLFYKNLPISMRSRESAVNN